MEEITGFMNSHGMSIKPIFVQNSEGQAYNANFKNVSYVKTKLKKGKISGQAKPILIQLQGIVIIFIIKVPENLYQNQ